jgi:hypothetical protein
MQQEQAQCVEVVAGMRGCGVGAVGLLQVVLPVRRIQIRYRDRSRIRGHFAYVASGSFLGMQQQRRLTQSAALT